MNNQFKNKIEATDTTIRNLLQNQKFTIDYFQREYRWKDKHIKLLVDDLTSAFLKSYKSDDERSAVENYQKYYLGPVVFSINNGKQSIIDGQQRITSITLLLIYINQLQKNIDTKVNISDLIFSEKYGEKSFNMSDDNRKDCLKALYEDGDYTPKETEDETIYNMVDRYHDIQNEFSDEINNETVLPFFIDWLIDNVIIVKITAYSDENAYTIFETMNDRGLNLTPTEMLKGYVLSKINDHHKRIEIDNIWKNEIKKLHSISENSDQSFFQAWFRAKYAEDIRPGGVGAENQDFELIGTRFHGWFRDNHKTFFNIDSSEEFYQFFKNEFPFFVKWYMSIHHLMRHYDAQTPHLNYIYYWGIAESLQEPLLLASINFNDSDGIIKKKMDFVARYIETFTVRRSVNYKKFGQTSIRYSMFNIIKMIRNNSLQQLALNLKQQIEEIPQKWDAIYDFVLHGQNKKFIKHLLSRISNYVDSIGEVNSSYADYYHPENGKPFEIEHIWANRFEEHRDEFEQENEFQRWRNSIGALILLPQGTNQSFKDDPYEKKLPHYIKENNFAKTLHSEFYEKNPNFTNKPLFQSLNFQCHKNFKKEDIKQRIDLVQRLCENIWSIDYFSIETE